MVGDGLYPWGQLLTTLLLSLVCQLFDYPLGQMPYIILMTNVWVVPGHAAGNGNVAVCCYSGDVNSFPLQHFNGSGEALLLHSIR